MAHSWIAVINLFIIILASVVVNMQGNNTPGNVDHTTQHSTGDEATSMSTLTTESTTDESTTDESTTDESTTDGSTTDEARVTNQTITTIHPTTNNGTDSVALNGTDNGTDSTPQYEYQEPVYRAFVEYDIFTFLRNYAHWFNAFPRIFLNLFCVVVTVTMKPFNTTSLFVLVLAIADFCVVSIRFIYKHRVTRIKEHFDCVIYFAILNVSMTLSNFILVVWTLERMIALRFPLKVQTWCSMKNTKIAVLITVLFAFVMSTPYYLFSRKDDYGGCLYTDFILTTWFLVDNAYYVWIPLVIVWLSNMVIIYSIQQTKKAHAAMTQNVQSIEKRRKEQAQLSIILISLSVSFIIFHIPQIIATGLDRRYPDPWVLYDDPKAFISFHLYTELAYNFTYIQNNINFLLYCSAGRNFRRQFIYLLCFCRTKCRRPIDGTGSMTNITATSQRRQDMAPNKLSFKD